MQEILPGLVRMVQRPLRAVVSHLFTRAEKAAMRTLVSMLITYGFTFDLAPLEAGDDSAPLMLKPEIQRICTFPVSIRPPKIMYCH
jgi:hypothetical protein